MRSLRTGTLAALGAAVLIAGCDSARPLEQRSAEGVCERCHGFPPPDPHPQSAGCTQCHSATVAPGDVLVEGGAHMNGKVDIVAHAVEFLPVHSGEALRGLGGCTACHGSDFGGGASGESCNACHATLTPIAFPDWQTNCTFCHGTPTAGWTPAQLALAAPPQSVAGAQDPSVPGVGAHQAHVTQGPFANAFACTECHPAVTGLGHVDRVTQIAFGATASHVAPAAYESGTCSTYCHGASLPAPAGFTRTAPQWAPPSAVTCNSCHQANPTTGKHPGSASAGSHAGISCGACHGAGVYRPDNVDRAIHLNRTIDRSALYTFDAAARTCSSVACHSFVAPMPWGQ